MQRLLPWAVALLVGGVFYSSWILLDRLLGGKELSPRDRAACAVSAVSLLAASLLAILRRISIP